MAISGLKERIGIGGKDLAKFSIFLSFPNNFPSTLISEKGGTDTGLKEHVALDKRNDNENKAGSSSGTRKKLV